jgi:mannose-6-phosphate isomerase-like protein (cupin superfamily)
MPGMDPAVTFARLDPDSVAPESRFQRLRQELGAGAFGLNLIVLRPGQRGRIHRHERQEEVYLVLAGTLTLLVEGEERELGRGELALVPGHLRRQLVNRRGERLELLAIGGAGEHQGRDGEAFTAWDQERGAPPQETPLPEDVTVASDRGGSPT